MKVVIDGLVWGLPLILAVSGVALGVHGATVLLMLGVLIVAERRLERRIDYIENRLNRNDAMEAQAAWEARQGE